MSTEKAKIEVVRALTPEVMEQVWKIRRKVFIEEQKVDARLEFEHEDEAHQFLARLNGVPVGAARWRDTGKAIKLERFAVLPDYRNVGVGAALLKAVLHDAPKNRKIYLHAQTRAVDFYLKHGFVKVGEEFEEAGIAHFTMELPFSL